METITRGQLSRSAADIYEAFFVPALFGAWPPHMADAAGITANQTVLDVACGTGALAREAARRVGPGGSVTGLDCNEGMLAVARQTPEIQWRQGVAEALPFESDSFDAVVSQFGLMFFDNRAAALREMWRVLTPGGHLAVAVWDSLDRTPGYADMVALLQRLFGTTAADALRAPYTLGNSAALRALFAASGIPDVDVRTVEGTARFPSIEGWVTTDVKGWTLGDAISEAQFRALLAEAERTLTHHRQPDGTVTFSAPAIIVTSRKP